MKWRESNKNGRRPSNRPNRFHVRMVQLKTVEEFEGKAKEMIMKTPKKARLTTKYKKSESVFVMKITDGKECFKFKVVKEDDFKKSQKIIAQLMHLMTSNELMQ